MEQETIKILCTNCLKKDVCKFKDDFTRLVREISLNKKTPIHKITVDCIEYREMPYTQRHIGAGSFIITEKFKQQLRELT